MSLGIIAIDGPAASGKSSVGSRVARGLGFLFFDTGVMYRAVALAALEAGVPLDDEDAVTRLAHQIRIDVRPEGPPDGRQYSVFLDGRDITWDIRSRGVDAAVSTVAAYPEVRRVLTARQREIAAPGRMVLVGRDIGTVVMPEADLKIYLKASPQERARRRHREMRGRGKDAPYQELLEGMIARDSFDASRQASPMRPAEDAIEIDTDALTEEEVVEQILSLVKERV